MVVAVEAVIVAKPFLGVAFNMDRSFCLDCLRVDVARRPPLELQPFQPPDETSVLDPSLAGASARRHCACRARSTTNS